MRFWLLLVWLLLVACAPAAASPSSPNPTLISTAMIPTAAAAAFTPTPLIITSPTPTTTPINSEPEQLSSITLPIVVSILDDSNKGQSSTRTAEQLIAVYQGVNTIWGQAHIVIEVQTIERVTIPTTYLTALSGQNFNAFYAGIGYDFDLPATSLLNGFYAADIGGPNGVTPNGTRTFFVTDFPSVHHERVTAHEIGHILGLHHTLSDDNRLMYPGSNGMILTDEEIAVARYVAKGLLDGMR